MFPSGSPVSRWATARPFDAFMGPQVRASGFARSDLHQLRPVTACLVVSWSGVGVRYEASHGVRFQHELSPSYSFGRVARTVSSQRAAQLFTTLSGPVFARCISRTTCRRNRWSHRAQSVSNRVYSSFRDCYVLAPLTPTRVSLLNGQGVNAQTTIRVKEDLQLPWW